MTQRPQLSGCQLQLLEPRLLFCTLHEGHVVSGNLVYSEESQGWIRQSDVGTASPAVIDSATPAPLDPAAWSEAASLEAGQEGPIAAAAPTAYTTGAKDILILRVRFSDQATTFEPQTLASGNAMLASLDTFFRTNSFGATWLDLVADVDDPKASAVTPVYVLPGTRADYTTWGDARVLSDARLVARNPQNYPGNEGKTAYDSNVFDQYAVRYSEGPGGFLGQAYVGARGTWLKSNSAGVAAHEFGHNLGLWHANYWDPTSDISAIGAGSNLEYGDPYDSMNSSAQGGNYGYTAYHQDRLGWLNNQTETVTSSGVYRVYAHDLGGSLVSGADYALKFAKDSTRTYWVGMRQSMMSNVSLANAVELHWFDTAQDDVGSQFIDTLPLTSARGDGTIQIGRTFSDDMANIHITPVAKGIDGSLPWMDVQITFGSPAGNHVPTASISASTVNATVGQNINFFGSALDADGDTLAYYWDFGDRTFSTTNSAGVTKAFSAAGEYRVRLVVSDAKGQETSTSVLVKVGNTVTNKYTGRITDGGGNPIGGALINNGLAISDTNYRWTYTDSDGYYTLAGVPAGTYTLGAFAAGYTLSPSGFINPVNAAADVQNINFSAAVARYLLKGRMLNVAGGGVAGVLVTIGSRSELTDVNGYFNFFDTETGIYSVTASKLGYVFPQSTIAVEYANSTSEVITESSGYVSGQILGLNNANGVTVTNGSQTATVLINGANGIYSMNLPVGTWTLRALKTGGSYTPSGFTNPIVVTAGSSQTRNFSIDSTATYSVAGTITHLGQPLAATTVIATSNGVTRQVQTDDRGGYYIDGLTNGTWILTPTFSGRTFTPTTRTVTINGANPAVQNFATTTSNAAPTVTQAAQAVQLSPFTAQLSALGADDGGEAYLVYTWSMVSGPAGAALTYSANGLSGTDRSVVTFNRAGAYTLRVTIKDLQGSTVTSNVAITIDPIATSVSIASPWAATPLDGSQQMTASLLDQFGQPMPSQPAFTWQATGGSISPTGLYTATGYGAYDITATASGFSATVPMVTTYPQGPGTGLLREVWTGVSGNGVSSLTAVINAGTLSNSSSVINSFEFAGNGTTSYGERLRGLFIAPVTGSYIFWIAADDTGELYLSTDSTPGNKQLIASVTSSTTPRQWDKSTSQKSVNINLVAGQRYYIEALHKQGSGTDHVAVRVQMPGNITEEVIGGHRLDPYTQNSPPTVATAAAASPATTTTATTTLSVLGADDSGESNLTYTWSVSSKPSGASDPTFSVNGTNASKSTVATFTTPGNYQLLVTIADGAGGTVTSTVAVTVVAPAPAPVLTSALSRKSHGQAGTFDIDLPLNGSGIEVRSGGASSAYQLIFNFDTRISSGNAVLASGTGVISGVVVSASSLVVSLTGVADMQKLKIRLQGVAGSGTGTLESATVTVGFLIGDSTGDGSVANGDVSQIRSRVGLDVTAANFRSDVNADGSIANGDVSQARSKVGNSVPAAAPDDDEWDGFGVPYTLLQELR